MAKNLNEILGSDKLREQSERTNLEVTEISKKNMPRTMRDHITVQEQMRGVVARHHLPKNFVVVYGAQYLKEREMNALSRRIANKLSDHYRVGKNEAKTFVDGALRNYSWDGPTLRGTALLTNAWGAGNVAAFINHDDREVNMQAVRLSTRDSNGTPTGHIIVYRALRDIEKGEQLLVKVLSQTF